jgi:hypothetical protein
MDPMSPIAGISLARYAELSADVTDVFNDPEQCAKVVESKGVTRAAWEEAKIGWTARMQDMALMGSVATAYMPMYQAALAKKNGSISVGFDDFVAMSGASKAWGAERMYAFYGIDMGAWTQIAGSWTQTIGREMQRYASYGTMVEQEGARIAAGGQPRPVAIQRLAGGQTASPQAAAPMSPAAQAAVAQQQYENQMMGQAVQGQVAAQMAAAQAQAAAAYGNASANMGFLGRGALGVMGYGAIAAGIGPGMAVLVQWSDGNRYPAKVTQVGGGQVCIALSDGRQMWVPETAVTRT